MSPGEMILYATEDGKATLQLRAVQGTVWLTLNQLAELFDRDKSVISRHVASILSDGELAESSVVARFATTAADGKTYQVEHYRLEMALAVGFRVRSPRGVQFRRWANETLKEYLVKGFAMDDAKLKDPSADYFDELLERIRDIRASEARFYRKVRDILSLSQDYVGSDPRVQIFYATIQNKMLHAATGSTAAELIVERADAAKPNMGLTSWKAKRVRKQDVGTAKNYLGQSEIGELNLIVTMFLDAADLRARRRQAIRLAEWEDILDRFLVSNELPVLRSAGRVTAARAERVALERYETFEQRRKAEERDSEPDDLEELNRIAEAAKARLPASGAKRK